MNIDNIIKNSRTLKQLVKDISDIKEANESAPSNVTGVGFIDKKLEQFQDTFKDNETIKFFKDPAKGLGNAFKGMFRPLEAIGDGIEDTFKKGFAGISQAAQMKMLKENNKNLKKIAQAQNKLTTSLNEFIGVDQDKIVSDAVAEGIGQSIIRDSIAEDAGAYKENLKAIFELKSSFALVGSNIQGAVLRSFTGLGKSFTAGFEKALGKEGLIASLGKSIGLGKKADGAAQIKNKDLQIREKAEQSRHRGLLSSIRRNIRDPLQSIIGTLQRAEVSLEDLVLTLTENPKVAQRLRDRAAARKDQAEAEQRRDDKLFQEKLANRQMEFDLTTPSGDDEDKGGKGIFSWLKENLGAVIGGALGGGAVAVAGGLTAFFGGLVAAFAKLAAGLKPILVGSLALVAIAGALYSFSFPLKALKESLAGFGLEEALSFATILGVVAGALVAFGALFLAGGWIALLAGMAGLAIVGVSLAAFGGILSQDFMKKGFENLTNFFDALGDPGTLAGRIGALALLAPALVALGSGMLVGGLLSLFGGGVLNKLTDFAENSGNLKGASDSVDKLTKSLGSLQKIKGLGDVGNFLKLTSSTLGGGFTGNAFKNKMSKAADGLEIFFNAMAEGIKKIDKQAMEDVNELLGNVGSLNDVGNQITNSQSINRNLELLLASANNSGSGGTVVNQGGNSTTVTNNNYTPPHIDSKTFNLITNPAT